LLGIFTQREADSVICRMNTPFVRYAFVALVLISALAQPACNTKLPSVKELERRLAGDSERGWQYLSIVRDGLEQAVAPCLSDDQFLYRKDSTYKLTNPVTCQSSEQNVVTGTWRFSNGGREFILKNSLGAESVFFLKELSDNRFTLTFQDQQNPGQFIDWVFVRFK
jgi:hypothetical protein